MVGPALSLKVSSGDSIRLQVKASYEQGSSAQPQGLEALAATLASALGATPPAGLETVGAAPEALSQALAGTALLDDDGSGTPNAYLNYLLFDTAYQLLDQGFVKVSQAAKTTIGGKAVNNPSLTKASVSAGTPETAPVTQGEKLNLEIAVASGGILYAYVSNESNWDAPVMFDNFSVQQTTLVPEVVDRQDYYSFGLTHEQPLPGQPTNRYLFQNAEITNNFDISLYDYGMRANYDPALGRWGSVDPLAGLYASQSSYHFVGNNPIHNIEINGASYDDSNGGGGDKKGKKGKKQYKTKGKDGKVRWIRGPRSSGGGKHSSSENSNATYNGYLTGGSNKGLGGGNGSEKANNQSDAPPSERYTFDIKPTEANPGLIFPMIAAAEEALVALGIVAGVTYHANSKKSRKNNYLYEIRSYGVSSFDDISDWNVFDVEKYGISSDNGYRVQRQVDVLNRANDGRVYSYIIRHNAIPGRFEALLLEKFYVTHYAATHGGQVPRLQVKPIPW